MSSLPSEKVGCADEWVQGPWKELQKVWKYVKKIFSHVYQEVKPKGLKHHGSFEMPDIFVFDGHAPFLTTVSA